jgi:hypothetical protein
MGTYIIREVFSNNFVQLKMFYGLDFPTCTSESQCKGFVKDFVIDFNWLHVHLL